MEQEFELKVAMILGNDSDGAATFGRTFTDHWLGSDGTNAAERYVDCHRDRAVIAWRPLRHGLFIGAPGPGSD